MLKKTPKSESFRTRRDHQVAVAGGTSRRDPRERRSGYLLVLQDLIDDDSSAFIDRDDFVDGDIAA